MPEPRPDNLRRMPDGTYAPSTETTRVILNLHELRWIRNASAYYAYHARCLARETESMIYHLGGTLTEAIVRLDPADSIYYQNGDTYEDVVARQAAAERQKLQTRVR